MALELIVSPILGVLVYNLNSLIQKEVGLTLGVDQEMKNLASTLSTIQAVLQNAEEKQLTEEAVVKWLQDLRTLSYEADDILDDWRTEAVKLQSGAPKQVCGTFFSCFSLKQCMFHRTIARNVNELQKKFSQIAAERFKYHLTTEVVERRLEQYRNPETSSLLNTMEVYGRDEEKEGIVNLLLNNVNTEETLSVCSVVGIGGLGKTTLARLCYNDQRVKEHFDVMIWVCVSDDFDVKRLTRAAIVSVSNEMCTFEDLDPLQRRLQEKLTGKRFLLVLDDVWNENQEVWSTFESSLRCGAIGSSVIITTRLKQVAKITSTCSTCFLSYLPENDCWSLFKKIAFGKGNEESPKFVQIGREIVKKCGGVPLAAKVLGSLMQFEHEESEWLYIRDSEIWNLPQSKGNTILSALRLSYNHLDMHLRQCFFYCSMFPKNYRIEKQELIRFWMANDLIHSKGEMQLEDIGTQIINALCWRSFFQDEEETPDGLSISFVMHDLVHDLACSINMKECYHISEGSHERNVHQGTRHLSIRPWMQPLSFVQSMHHLVPNLRTLLFFDSQGFTYNYLSLSYFKYLRVLSMRSADKKLLDSVRNLKHLRYLCLSGTNIVLLPESICELCNLQSLELESCYALEKLPRGMCDMRSLRHLNIRGCRSLREMPIELGKLTCLRTLSIFIVGTDSGRHIKELEGLDYISGELAIKRLGHVKTAVDAKEANLMRKRNLLSLSLDWSGTVLQVHNMDVVEGLQPHPNLKRLSLEGYKGLTFPSWLDASSLPNLVHVKLFYCRNWEFLPSFDRLPLLTHLVLRGMHFVKIFTSDIANELPRLESLHIYEMRRLENWFPDSNTLQDGDQANMFPRLKTLTIFKCAKLKSLFPSLLSLETLDVLDSPLILGSLKNLPCLSSLFIRLYDEMSFPNGSLQNLPSLRSLNIWDCHALHSLPDLEGCSSLTELNIMNCASLTNVSQGLRCQATLQSLAFSKCPQVDFSMLEFQRFKSLVCFQISYLHDMTSLPGGLRHVSSTLKYLHIYHCTALNSLPHWIGRSTHLEYLTLWGCTSLRSLPEGLQYLAVSRTLKITNCHPELHKRCEKERGDDWPMIAHIPHIYISGPGELN